MSLFPFQVPGLTLQVHDGQLDKWYGTCDIKANACDIISEVIVPTPITEEEILSAGSVADDMDTSSLEAMFQLQPSAISSMTMTCCVCVLHLLPPAVLFKS